MAKSEVRSADVRSDRRPVWMPVHPVRAVARVIIGLALAFGPYYVLRALGMSVWAALIAPSIATAVFMLARWARDRTIDPLALMMLIVLLAGIGLAAWSGSAQLMLLKGALVTAVTGIVFLISLWWRRPLTLILARSLVVKLRITTRDWDEVWQSQPRFRGAWRTCTVIWAVSLLADAAIVTWMASTLPVDAVPALTTGLRFATFAVVQVITNVHLGVRGVWRMLELDTHWFRRDRRPADS